MADRLSALAGFVDSSISVSNASTSAANTGPSNTGAGDGKSKATELPPGLITDASISLMPPPAVVPRKGATGGRPKTPPKGNGKAPSSSTLQVPPSTTRKADTRRRYGITIGGAAGAPLDDDEEDDLDQEDGRSMDSEAELKKMREQLVAQGPGALNRRPSNRALGDLTNASNLADATAGTNGSAGVNTGDEIAEDSGQWGTRALARRAEKGTNLKQLQARIDQLTSERDDLKIEVDYHRSKGKIQDTALEVINLRQEKLTYVKKVMNLNELVKKQDKAMTQLRKANKFWEGKKVEDWTAMQDEIRKLRAEREQNEKQQARLQDEVEFLKSLREERSREEKSRSYDSHPGNDTLITDLREELAAIKEDHKVELYTLQRERDELVDQVEDLKVAGPRQGRRSLKSQVDSDAEGDGDRSSATIGAERSPLLARRDETIRRLEEKEAEVQTDLAETKAQLAGAVAQNEELQAQIVDLKSGKESLERDMAFLKDRIQLSEARLEKEGEDATREMVALQHALEERTQTEIEHWKDQVTSWKIQVDKQELRCEELEAACEEWEGKYVDLEYEMRRVEAECNEKEEQLAEVETEADNLEAKNIELEQHIQDLEEEINATAVELENANAELDRISALLREAEESRDARGEEIAELNAALDDAEIKLETAERRDQALKERLNDAQVLLAERESKILELDELHQTALGDVDQLAKDYDELAEKHRSVKSQLSQMAEELQKARDDLRAEERLSQQQADDFALQLKQQKEEFQSALESKEMDLAATENHNDTLKGENVSLKDDLQKLQNALREQADQSQRLGQSHTNDKYALELEIDRLKRQIATLERELDSVAKASERKEDLIKERDAAFIRANSEIRELSSKFAAEQQARLGLSDRFDAQARALKEAQLEADEARAKLDELDQQRNNEDKKRSEASDQAVGQLKERNTLLLTVYQNLGRILGNDKLTGRKRDDAELKPFTNFGVFHDSLVSRIKRLGELQSHFEMRAKDMESKFTNQFSTIKKQQDAQSRHITRLEQTLKSAADKQGIWRSRIVAKQAELDAAKSTNNELQQQISSLRTRSALESPASNSKLTSLNSRANNAERKLAVAQTQQAQAEERLEDAKRKYDESEGKWAARIKELEHRCRAAEEKNTRDRQAAKDRVKELEEQLRRAIADEQRARKQDRRLSAHLKDLEGARSSD